MKKKKRIITTLGLLLIAVVGATFAYYTSNTIFENVFNAGKYKVTLTEIFESPDNWVPGETVPKTVTAKNDGTVPAAVRISYTEQWLKEIDGVETDITSQVSPNPAIINFANQGDWTLSNGYYYYKYILEPTDETSSFISGVTLDPNLDSVTCTGEGNEKTCEAQNPASGAKYKLTFTIQTVQADQYESIWNTNVEITEKSAIRYLSRQVEGQITPGDVVGIGETEDFYVISSDSNKTVLFAKYNLLVGYDQNWSGMISSTTPGYGLQNVDALGYNGGSSIATVAFSETSYWMNSNTLKDKYSQNDTIYYDEPNYVFRYRNDNTEARPYVYDENSSIYQYISGEDGYVNRLKSIGAPSTITGRLLSYEEADSIKNIVIDSKNILFDDRQDFWIGSAFFDTGIYYIDGVHHDFGDTYWTYGHDDVLYGVRPVIEIPTSELQ